MENAKIAKRFFQVATGRYDHLLTPPWRPRSEFRLMPPWLVEGTQDVPGMIHPVPLRPLSLPLARKSTVGDCLRAGGRRRLIDQDGLATAQKHGCVYRGR